MRTIAGVAAKGNNVIDTIRRNIVNNMMEAMHKRWNSLINESDDSNFFTLIGFLKSVDTEIEPQIYHENEEISFCRNAFGVGTLYWHETDNYIFYASEIKALFKIGGLTPQPDIQGIAENFVYWVPLRNRTVFQNICRLESNQIVKFNRSGVRIVDTSIVPLISRLEDHVQYARFIEETRTDVETFKTDRPNQILMDLLANLSFAEGFMYSVVGSSRFSGRLLSIYLPTLEIQMQNLLRVPFCEACGTVSRAKFKELNISSRRIIDDLTEHVFDKE